LVTVKLALMGVDPIPGGIGQGSGQQPGY